MQIESTLTCPTAGTDRSSKCRPMRAGFLMSARAAARGSSRCRAIAACSVPMARCRARRCSARRAGAAVLRPHKESHIAGLRPRIESSMASVDLFVV